MINLVNLWKELVNQLQRSHFNWQGVYLFQGLFFMEIINHEN